MGNYYKRKIRFGNRRSPRGKRIVFICGLVLVAAFALLQFTDIGNGVKSAAQSTAKSVVAAAGAGVDWGKEKIGGTEGTVFDIPVSSGVVVEEFGVIADAEGQEAYHNGIDIQVPAGSEVLAAADGTVADIATHDDGTYWITVSHEKNWSTVYGRLGEVAVSVDQKVEKGAVLGKPASDILHFEVLKDNIEKDPVHYFKTEEDVT